MSVDLVLMNECLVDQLDFVLESDVCDDKAHTEHDEFAADEEVWAESSRESNVDGREWLDRRSLALTLGLAEASELLFVEQADLSVAALLLVFGEAKLILVTYSENLEDWKIKSSRKRGNLSTHRWNLTIDLAEQWDRVGLVLAV